MNCEQRIERTELFNINRHNANSDNDALLRSVPFYKHPCKATTRQPAVGEVPLDDTLPLETGPPVICERAPQPQDTSAPLNKPFENYSEART